jgi:hypothetical protein
MRGGTGSLSDCAGATVTVSTTICSAEIPTWTLRWRERIPGDFRNATMFP